MFRYACALILAAAVASCGGGAKIVSTERLTVVRDATALPAPERQDLVAPDRLALIGPLDILAVDVFGVPDFTRQVQVDAGGRIAMPLIGTIDAGGQTAGELASTIAAALRGRFVRNPNVTVNIVSSVSQVVTVDGEVVEPGLYPVTNQTTLLRAVASAKGMTEFARRKEVVILRKVQGRNMAALYDIGAIRRGAYEDPFVYANDVIVVGDSPQRRLFRDLISVTPLLAAPLVAILQ